MTQAAARRATLFPAEIAVMARDALYMELDCDPKPGLVTPTSNGSHTDMDYGIMARGIDAIAPFFADLAMAGAAGAGFKTLQGIGIDAERAMLTATRGINTHRGAIFTLGLLAAAAGVAGTHEPCRVVAERWGADIARTARARPVSHGTEVGRKYGVAGARLEAAEGFPTIRNAALPAFASALDAGLSMRAAAMQSLYASMAVMDDINILHRGGPEGLTFVQDRAAAFLQSGGVFQEGWENIVCRHDAEFVARRLSSGGAADLVSASIFLTMLSGRRLPSWD